MVTQPGGLAKRDVVVLCVLVAATSTSIFLAIPEDTRGMSVRARVCCVRVCMRACTLFVMIIKFQSNVVIKYCTYYDEKLTFNLRII